MISATLARTVPGYTVEGVDFDSSHPQHPSRKAGALFKTVKLPQNTGTVKKHPKAKAKKRTNGGSVITDQTIQTRPGGGPD